MTDHRDSSWRRGRCHALWLHQGGLCFHCGRPMPDPLIQRERHRKRGESATIEHVLPRTLGGLTSWRNEVAACRACNAGKADRLPTAMELWRLAWLKRDGLEQWAENFPRMVRSLRAPRAPGLPLEGLTAPLLDAVALVAEQAGQ